MILLPLGFGRKLPVFPWATIALALSILIVSIPYFSSVQEIESTRRSAMKTSGYAEQLKKFAATDCPASGLEETQCSMLISLIDQRLGLAKAAKSSKTSKTSNPAEVNEKKRNQKIIEEKGFSKGLAAIAKDQTKLLEYAKLLFGPTAKFSERMRETSGFEELSEAEASINAELSDEYKKISALAKSNQGIKQLILAQWTHMGWAHLLGNLFVFIALAPVLEARMGRIAFLGLYLVGGTLGLLLQLHFLKGTDGILLGASANISAVIGGFFVFYFNRPMKVLASFIFYNRVLDCPTWLMIPVLFLLNDISGALDQSGGVAHLAHLGGFALGAAMAFFMKENDGLNKAYIYPIEYDWHLQLRASPVLSEKIALAGQVLKYNPENSLVANEVLQACLKFASENPQRIGADVNLYISLHFGRVIQGLVALRKSGEALQMLEETPLQISLIDSLASLNQTTLIHLSELSLKNGDWLLTFRLYDAFRVAFPKASGAQTMEEAMTKILAHLRETGADLSPLEAYSNLEPASSFHSLITEFASTAAGDVYESAS